MLGIFSRKNGMMDLSRQGALTGFYGIRIKVIICRLYDLHYLGGKNRFSFQTNIFRIRFGFLGYLYSCYFIFSSKYDFQNYQR